MKDHLARDIPVGTAYDLGPRHEHSFMSSIFADHAEALLGMRYP